MNLPDRFPRRSLFARCRSVFLRGISPALARRQAHSLAPATIFLDAASDSGVAGQVPTLGDGITNDTTPTFFGIGTASSTVHLYVLNALKPGGAVLIGETTASSDGYYVVRSNLNLNSVAVADGLNGGAVDGDVFGNELDGLRVIAATFNEPAGTLTSPVKMEIFLDTRGPEVTGVFFDPLSDIAVVPEGGTGATVSVFDPQPAAGPTPLTNTVIINFRDLPVRATGDSMITGGPFQHAVLNSILAAQPGMYQLVGDHVGVLPIQSIIFIGKPFSAVNPASGYATLNFNPPLADDRYTLTVSDALTDDAGNKLDGESNAAEPTGFAFLPSGDGVPGGAFKARFTVDSRPEVGVFSNGVWYVDLNGDGRFDTTGSDATNTDVAYVFGVVKDLIVTGSWDQNGTAAGGTTTDGFDRIGAYGKRGKTMNFELDLNGNGVFDENDAMNGGSFAFGKGGMPVAGHWPGAGAGNDDRVGLFKGGTWMLDLNGNHVLDAGETFAKSGFTGTPIAGDWTGTGVDRVGTFSTDTFFLDMNGDFKFDATDIAAGGKIKFTLGAKSQVGVVGDWDGDGETNIGLVVKDRVDITPTGTAEWYLDNGTPFTGPLGLKMAAAFGGTGSLTGVPGDGRFQPPPTGGLPGSPSLPAVLQDMFLQFGGTNKLNVPFVGNFDPPHGGATTAQSLPLVDHADTLGANATPVLLPADGSAWHGAGAIGTVKDKDVFQFTPTASGRLTIDASKFNSQLDTKLSVFLGSERIAFNDNFAHLTDSHLAIDVLAGQTYFIQIAGSRGSAGAYNLLVDFDASAAPSIFGRSDRVWQLL